MADDARPGSSQPADSQPADGQPADGQPAEEPFQELLGYEWTEKAYHMLMRGELNGEVISREKIIRSRVWGPCPRCGHDLDDRQTHTAVIGIMGAETRGGTTRGGVDDEEAPFEVDVSCGCDGPHSGAPEGKTGCGVSFRVALPLHPADG